MRQTLGKDGRVPEVNRDWKPNAIWCVYGIHTDVALCWKVCVTEEEAIDFLVSGFEKDTSDWWTWTVVEVPPWHFPHTWYGDSYYRRDNYDNWCQARKDWYDGKISLYDHSFMCDTMGSFVNEKGVFVT